MNKSCPTCRHMVPQTILRAFQCTHPKSKGLINLGKPRCNGEHWEPKPSERQWRTLIRIHSVDTERGLIHVVIPGWDVRTKVCLDLSSVPADIRPLLAPGKRLHAQVNIGAETANDLRFGDWEPE